MSRDDEIDYRQMYPIEGRTRKRRSANPKPQKKPEPRGGFFRDEPKPSFPKDRVQKDRKPDTTRNLGRRDPDDRPTRSMGAVAREIIAKDLDLTVNDVIEQLEAMDYEAAPITISTIREEIFTVLRLCRKHGSIKVPAWDD